MIFCFFIGLTHINKIDTHSGKIKPDGRLYSLNSVKKALKGKTGATPRVTCNEDPNNKGVFQLYQIFFCVEAKGKNFIECPSNLPNLPARAKCTQKIKFHVYKKHNEIITEFLIAAI